MQLNQTDLKKVNLFFLTLVITLLPFIMHLKLVIFDSSAAKLWGSFINLDFYSYYKMIFLLTISALILVIFLLYLRTEDLLITKYYFPMIIYAIFILLAAVFTEYSEIVIKGFPDRFENSYVLLAYLVLTVVSLNLVAEKESVFFLLKGLLVASALLSIQGIFQFYNLDLLTTSFGKHLVTPPGLEFFTNQLSFIGKKVIYSTLYNPNYVGSYAVMVLALALTFFMLAKRKRELWVWGFLTLLYYSFLVGSRSRAGFLSFLAVMVLLIIILGRQLKKNYCRLIVILFLFCLIFAIMGARSVDSIFSDILFPLSESELAKEALILPPITQVDFNSKKHILTLFTTEAKFKFILQDSQFKLLQPDSALTIVKRNSSGVEYDFLQFNLSKHQFLANYKSTLKWNYGSKKAVFVYQDSKLYLKGIQGHLFPLTKVEHWGFSGYERLGSSRLYIWSRTIPLLKKTFFIGHGADSFAMYFPQQDVVGKLKYFNDPAILVDKPHNLYLQIAINTGVLSLLALLVLWLSYLAQSINLYFKASFNCWEQKTGLAVMLAIAAYLMAGFFNDSVVSVAPIFWILLGIGIRINLKQLD